MRKPTAWIISPTYNCKRYIKAHVLSVQDQLKHYRQIVHVIVDDCSTDGTRERLLEMVGDHHIVLKKENSASALESFMDAVGNDSGPNFRKSIKEDDVIFWLDGDDWLCDPRAIKKMMSAYSRNPEVEMCYSNHLNWEGDSKIGGGFSHPLSHRTLVRYDNVAYSHLRSFSPHMLELVADWRLRDDNGDYWKFAGDSALFLPMLEVAKRVKYIQEPFVIYNMEREDNEAKKDSTAQAIASHSLRCQVPNTNNRKDVYPKTQFAPTRRFKLDHGRVCNLSCSFCYYRHQKPWRNITTEQVEQQIIAGRQRGCRMCDISGGEPTIAKDLPLWIDLCRKHGLAPGIITHGQDVKDKLENLWDHGLSDILFSVHGTKEYHEQVTGTVSRNGYDRLFSAMEKCRDSGFKFRTNTVLTENYETLPDLARELVKVKPLISNFINFNPYYEWKDKDKEFQAKVGTIAPYLGKAIDILTEAGTAVNVRYFPFCVLKGYEKHIVNMPQVGFDPYEWDYNCMPKTPERFDAMGDELADKTCIHTMKCLECGIAGTVCTGANRSYIETFGDDELEPYLEGEINDKFHFRKEADPKQLYNYLGPNFGFIVKRESDKRKL